MATNITSIQKQTSTKGNLLYFLTTRGISYVLSSYNGRLLIRENHKPQSFMHLTDRKRLKSQCFEIESQLKRNVNVFHKNQSKNFTFPVKCSLITSRKWKRRVDNFEASKT
jgi:hypothetical protein